MAEIKTDKNLHDVNQRNIHWHEMGLFKGWSIYRFLPELIELVRNSNVQSILDYGCGKAYAWKKGNMKLAITSAYNSEQIGARLYDPYVPEFSEKPPRDREYDLVICCDVLEHVPEGDALDLVLADLWLYSKGAIFINVDTDLSNKGVEYEGITYNAHETIKSREWWLEKISKQQEMYGNKFVKIHFGDVVSNTIDRRYKTDERYLPTDEK